MKLHLAWLLPVVLAAACDDKSSSGGGSCSENRDCTGAALCIQGQCRVECERRADCAADQLCVDNQCRSPHDACLIPADCAPFGLVCDRDRGECVPPGSGSCDPVSNPCPVDQACRNGVCVGSGSDGGPRPQPDLGSPAWDGGGHDAAPPPPHDAAPPPPHDAAPPPPHDAAPPPPHDAAPPPPDAAAPMHGHKGYGEPCRCAIECESSLCLVDPYDPNARTGHCTSQCDGDVTCPRLDRCVRAQVPPGKMDCPADPSGPRVGDIVNICAPNETGRPCNGPGDCLIDGTCVTPPDPIHASVPVQSVCGARCSSDLKCPPGFHCGQVANVGGGQAQACVADVTAINPCPNGDFRVCGGTCHAPPGFNEADITFCVTIDQGAGYCSCSCASAADCPAGFACSTGVIATGDDRRPGMCFPISGYTCPGGRTQPCLSQVCVGMADGEAFERCTSGCRNDNDCPRDHTCQDVGGQGTFCVVQP
jgi:hypothetical protein